MAQPTGPSPEQMRQMQQQFLAEAAKKGMTPEQFQEHQRQQLAADAAKQGLTVEQYVNQLKQRALQEHQMRQQQAQQAQQQQAQGQAQGQGQANQNQQSQTQKIPVNPGAAPKPEALAVAKFLRSQDLKPRTCILDGQRKEMFKGNADRPDTVACTKSMFTSQACISSTTIASVRKSAKQEQISARSQR
jgi:translocation protein SEC62